MVPKLFLKRAGHARGVMPFHDRHIDEMRGLDQLIRHAVARHPLFAPVDDRVAEFDDRMGIVARPGDAVAVRGKRRTIQHDARESRLDALGEPIGSQTRRALAGVGVSLRPRRVADADHFLRHADADQRPEGGVERFGDGVDVVVVDIPIDLVPLALPHFIGGRGVDLDEDPFAGLVGYQPAHGRDRVSVTGQRAQRRIEQLVHDAGIHEVPVIGLRHVLAKIEVQHIKVTGQRMVRPHDAMAGRRCRPQGWLHQRAGGRQGPGAL